MARSPEDIDLNREDIAHKPRRRRHRLKPAPNPVLVAGKAKLLSRALKRPLPPAIIFERENGGYVHHAAHSDEDLWDLQIADALGTRSQSVMREFLRHLSGLCSQAYDGQDQAWKPNESELSAILAMIVDLKPRNTSEAAMAAQMVAVHLLTMRMAKQAFNRGGMVMDRDAALTGKLARTYAMQMDAYQALRGKRRSTSQKITVRKETHYHQHQHLHDHRGDQESDGQPQATRAGAVVERSALSGPDTGGEVVPLRSGPRKASV